LVLAIFLVLYAPFLAYIEAYIKLLPSYNALKAGSSASIIVLYPLLAPP
jgi:hypothetical protein